MQSIFRDKVLWNDALTNLHTSWGAPGRHAPLPNSFVVRDDRGNRRKTLGGWSRGESLWSAYRVPEAARCLVILLPPLPSFPFYLSLHLTMTNPICSLSKATGYLCYFPPPSFLTQWSSSHLSFTLPRSWSAPRDKAVTARLGRRAHRPGNEEQPVSPVAAFRKPFNGFRHIC